MIPEKDGIPAWNTNAIPNIPHFGPEPDNSPCGSLLMLDRTYDPEYAALDLTLYPNPTHKRLTLELDLPRKLETLSISDITGNRFIEKSFADNLSSTFDLDTSALLYNGAHLTPRVAQADPLKMAQADPLGFSSGFQR